jgi:hypothetical protein
LGNVLQDAPQVGQFHVWSIFLFRLIMSSGGK